jgi:hypothetical protein
MTMSLLANFVWSNQGHFSGFSGKEGQIEGRVEPP